MERRAFLRKVATGAVLGAGVAGSRAFSSTDSGDDAVKGNGWLRVVDKGFVYRKGMAVTSGNCLCKNGDLLVSFNTSGDISAGQKVGIIRSKDNGKTWDAAEIYFESVFKKGGIEAGCSLTCLSNGRILLPYADGFYFHPGTNDYRRRALLFCLISDDHGRTWRNNKAQCYQGLEAFAFGTVVELPNGTLLLPLWGAYDKQGTWQPGIVKSKDGGETWGEYRPIARGHGNETPVILLPDGRLLALIRGYSDDPKRPFYVTHSQDGGDTWTEPRRVNMNGSAASLHLTPKGRLLTGHRRLLKGGNLYVSSSDDGGLTWNLELELQLPTGTWSYAGYPAFESLADGRIFVSFENALPSWYLAYNILEED